MSYPSLEEDEKDVLDFVVETSAEKNWDDFMRLVYSTYPIVARERYTKLDLVELAKEYHEVMPLLESSN